MPAAPTLQIPARFTHFAVLTLTVAVFAAVVAFVTLQLRAGLREQVLLREAEMLSSVASMQLANSATRVAGLGLTEVPGELLEAVLQTSKYRGVIAIRLFDAGRQIANAFPYVWSEEPPDRDDWASLVADRPIARLRPRDSLAGLAGLAPAPGAPRTDVPLLETWVPLRRTHGAAIAGAAQFWIDGSAVAAEFSRHDRRLAVQATLAWFAGSLVIVAALSWALRRLAAANQELQAQGEDLHRANSELVLAAKTSALGAVTAHFIHEIKNPLAGLEVFVANQAEAGAREEGGQEQLAAADLTRRLRTMINDVVAVLRDEQHGAHFELTGAEVAALALAKAQPAADRHGVKLVPDLATTPALAGRRANLAGLVLQNLLQNAIEAAPAGGTVRLGARAAADGAVEFLVEDPGPGLPEGIRGRLFQSYASTKVGGSGLGLALSYQLAQQAGGRLELLRSDPHGTCFRLTLPPVV
ncbi:MAG: HAMP domain-containing histidine kinase [Opitutus sp.]|nr:HAMP domain-containing histidine kinase [Opitutus sp.]